MLGSDYPFPLGEAHPGKLINSADFLDAKAKTCARHIAPRRTHVTQAQLLGQNALEFFAVSATTFARPAATRT